jgi:hypothetical protein
MGMKPKHAAGSRTAASAESGSPRPSSADAAQGGLDALLASEDLLFRDPFADFTPSAR